MLVLNKRILRYIFISIFLGISMFFVGKNQKNILPTSSIPVAEHTIVLDAGHGQPDRPELLVMTVFLKNK